MALVRNIHREPKKQTVVRTMITMCKELGIVVTSEGIEVPEERDELGPAVEVGGGRRGGWDGNKAQRSPS